MRIAMLMVVVLCTAAACSAVARDPAPTGPESKPTTRKVIAFGDSNTYAGFMDKGGGGHKDGDRWVERVQADSGGRLVVINEGRNGRTTASADDFATALKRTPDVAVILIVLGTNDFKNEKDYAATIAKCVANVEKMIDLAAKATPAARVVIVGPMNLSVERLTDYWKKLGYTAETDKAIARLGDAYKELAARRGCGFIGLHGAVSAENLPDGIHPKAPGHKQVAEAISKGLGEVAK